MKDDRTWRRDGLEALILHYEREEQATHNAILSDLIARSDADWHANLQDDFTPDMEAVKRGDEYAKQGYLIAIGEWKPASATREQLLPKGSERTTILAERVTASPSGVSQYMTILFKKGN